MYSLVFVLWLSVCVASALWFLRNKAKAGALALSRARIAVGTLGLSVLASPVTELIAYGCIYFFAKGEPRLMLNAIGYLQAVAVIFILCSVLSVFVAYLVYQRKAKSPIKFFIMMLAVNITSAAITLVEAPKLIWPLTYSLTEFITWPAFISVVVINLCAGILCASELSKIARTAD